MTTSALAFSQLLSMVTQLQPKNVTFLQAVSKVLDLGKLSDLEAVNVVHRLLRRVWSDVESLPHSSEEITHLKNFLRPFDPLLNFSQFHLSIEQSTQNFLNPSHIVGLMSVHLALVGFSPIIDIDNATKEVAAEFRRLRDELSSADIPEALKFVIITRLTQIIAALENYLIFGGRELEEQLEGLLGKIAVHRVAAPASAVPYYKRLLAAASLAIAGVATANKGVGEFKELAKHGTEFIAFLENLSDKS